MHDRPTHIHEREGDGKRNILLGWPDKQCLKHVSGFVTVSETSKYQNVQFNFI